MSSDKNQIFWSGVFANDLLLNLGGSGPIQTISVNMKHDSNAEGPIYIENWRKKNDGNNDSDAYAIM